MLPSTQRRRPGPTSPSVGQQEQEPLSKVAGRENQQDGTKVFKGQLPWLEESSQPPCYGVGSGPWMESSPKGLVARAKLCHG